VRACMTCMLPARPLSKFVCTACIFIVFFRQPGWLCRRFPPTKCHVGVVLACSCLLSLALAHVCMALISPSACSRPARIDSTCFSTNQGGHAGGFVHRHGHWGAQLHSSSLQRLVSTCIHSLCTRACHAPYLFRHLRSLISIFVICTFN
jgi:hypothetical protein